MQKLYQILSQRFWRKLGVTVLLYNFRLRKPELTNAKRRTVKVAKSFREQK